MAIFAEAILRTTALLTATDFHLYFDQNCLTLQRGFSARAELFVQIALKMQRLLSY